MSMRGGWIIELDIKSFYDTLDHRHLNAFFDQRVKDGVIRRVIGKWLKAGVLEEGTLKYPDEGTPQGGVISPLLANVYLHEVLDKWFTNEVVPRLQSHGALIRYADDAVIVLTCEEDARRLMNVLPKRFAKYGLQLHPGKTRVVKFERPSVNGKRGGERERPETFDFLGFTHHWGLSKNKKWIVKQKTASSRLTRALRRVREWCRKHAHADVREQQRALAQKLNGHFGYYGITGNFRALSKFHQEVRSIWRACLDRRSDRARMNWSRFAELLKRLPLPTPRVVHSVLAAAAKP
jgi:group II intron reverse transcriptase/maturase